MVTDLQHFLDLPDETPAPARRLAEQLGLLVRAASAGDTGEAWETALPCRRRPGNRPCAGRMVVRRADPGASIEWQCSACSDNGVISNWERTLFDLSPRRLAVAEAATAIVISYEVAAALRDLQLLDPDGERLVYRIRAGQESAVLLATDDDLDELIGQIAAEANHEPNRRRRRQLDTAFDALPRAAGGI